MKKYYCKIAIVVLSVAAIFLTANLVFVYTNLIPRLPANAQLVEEHNQVRLYNVDVPPESTTDGPERAYITDGGKILTVFNLAYDQPASIILVTNENVIVLHDHVIFPGQSGNLFSINREDRSVAYISFNKFYFFTAPDNSYAAFSSTGGSVELTSFGTGFSRTYSLNGDFTIGAMALSPDEKRILVLSEDTKRRSNEEKKVYAAVFLIDLEKDTESQLATQVATFEETLQEGPFIPFLGVDSNIVWDSDTPATITDDDGQAHIIDLPSR